MMPPSEQEICSEDNPKTKSQFIGEKNYVSTESYYF